MVIKAETAAQQQHKKARECWTYIGFQLMMKNMDLYMTLKITFC